MTDSKQGQTLASGRILGKGFLTMLVLAIASTLLIACGSSSGGDEASDDPGIQLVYQDWRTDWSPPHGPEDA